MPKPVAHRIGQLKQMAFSKTSKNSLTLFSGNIVGSVLALLSTIFVSRELGPEQFGVLGIFTAVLATAIGLTDLGLGTAAIKIISNHISTDSKYTSAVMKVIVKLELLSGLVIGGLGLLFAGPIAQMLGGDHLLTAVRMAFVASAFSSAGAFIGPFLNAFQKFLTNALMGLLAPLAKFLGVLGLVGVSGLHIDSVLLLYTVVPALAFAVGLFISPRNYLEPTAPDEEKRAFNEIFHFSKWILLSSFAMVLAGRIDVFLLSRFKGPEAVGLYSAALQLATIMPLLIGAITTVLLPMVSRMKTREEFLSYMKKVALASVMLSLALSLVLVFGDLIINLVFGSKYAGSLTAFKLLFTAYLVALVANPLTLVVYALDKPKVLTALNYVQLVVSVGMNFLIIPVFGMNAAAFTFLVINIIGGVGGTWYAIRKVRSM